MSAYSLYTTTAATGLLKKRPTRRWRDEKNPHLRVQNAVCGRRPICVRRHTYSLEQVLVMAAFILLNVHIWTLVAIEIYKEVFHLWQ